jgi:hypothetical protein
MTRRELKNRTAADVRLVAKTLHTYANRIEQGDLIALTELIFRVPPMLGDVRDRYLAGAVNVEAAR